MGHQCPVCGYTGLVDPPADFEICPCCGTEFGFDDELKSIEHLRAEWIDTGAHWFSKANPAPMNWEPVTQLVRAGFLRVQPNTSVTNSKLVTVIVGEAGPALCIEYPQRFNIPLRPGQPPVEFWYLPDDLTADEAAKIARVIEALAETE